MWGEFAVSTVPTLVPAPALHVVLEEGFPHRLERPEGELAPQGEAA